MVVDSIEESRNMNEADKVIQDSRDKERKLKSEVKKQDTYKRLNFHYDISDIPRDGSSLIKRLKEKYKDDNSKEGALLNNPQIQNLLGNILGEHVRERDKKREQRSRQEAQEQTKGNNENTETEEVEETETWEDYKERESSPENFEEFLLSDEGIRILMDEIDKHLDEEGNIHKNYPISEKDLKLKLKRSRYSIMQREYNEKNGNTTDAETQEIKQMGNIVVDGIDTAVGEYLKSGGHTFDEGMVRGLEELLNNDENKEIINKIKQNSTLKDDFNRALKESIGKYSDSVVIGDKLSLNTGNKQIDLQIRSYLFVYGKFFYPGLFKTNQGNQYYEQILPKIMEAILVADGDDRLKNIIRDNEFLEKERRDQEERNKRDKQRRQEAAKRIRENNKRYGNDDNGNRRGNPGGDTINGDINGATGAQIVRNSDISLSDFSVNSGNMEAFSESGYAKQKAFGIAWKNFKEANKGIDSILTPDDMRKLYNADTNNINEQARKDFLESDIMQGRSQEEVAEIYNILKTFPDNFSNAMKNIASGVQKQEKWLNEETRNHALGAVIDNVRFVFADIVEKWKGDSKFEGFKFDGSKPVTREGNDILISGTFNGTAIKIRYDLLSGGLFMNSFLQHPSTSKIVIGNNNKADLQIGQLESFDKILEEHYRAPDISLSRGSQAKNGGNQSTSGQNPGTDQGGNIWGDNGGNYEGELDERSDKKGLFFSARHFRRHENEGEETITTESTVTDTPTNNPSLGQSSFRPSTTEIGRQSKGEMEALRKKYRDMLYANLDMISNAIVDNTKKQSARNSVVTKFMRTFNIMTDGQDDKSLEFNDGSNLFDFLQIIENSDPAILEKFQTFMEKISDFSGLKWGSNNILGSNKDFDNVNKNRYTTMVIDNAKSFSKEPEKFKKNGVESFDSSHQLGFAKMIIENITDDAGKPNWKLDLSKMDDFIKHLETDGENS